MYAAVYGYTIAAVFLCLSAVSVKEFFAWLLLSALLLQLPEPVSDALPFGWCSMCRIEYPLHEAQVCASTNIAARAFNISYYSFVVRS